MGWQKVAVPPTVRRKSSRKVIRFWDGWVRRGLAERCKPPIPPGLGQHPDRPQRSRRRRMLAACSLHLSHCARGVHRQAALRRARSAAQFWALRFQERNRRPRTAPKAKPALGGLWVANLHRRWRSRARQPTASPAPGSKTSADCGRRLPGFCWQGHSPA